MSLNSFAVLYGRYVLCDYHCYCTVLRILYEGMHAIDSINLNDRAIEDYVDF